MEKPIEVVVFERRRLYSYTAIVGGYASHTHVTEDDKYRAAIAALEKLGIIRFTDLDAEPKPEASKDIPATVALGDKSN